MTVSSAALGTQTATINTEHTLATVTSPGVYVLVVDLTNMVSGDSLELRVKTKNQSGKPSVLADLEFYNNAQTTPQAYFVPYPADTEFKATLKQTAGTGRSYDWNVLLVS